MLEDRGTFTQRGGRLDQRTTHEEIFFSSWLRGDAEGIAEEMKKTNKNAQDEKKSTSGNKEFEGGGEGVEIDDESVCFGFCSTLTLFLSASHSISDSVCFARVFDVTAFSGSERDFFFRIATDWDASQTLSFSEKRGGSGHVVV